MEALIRCTVEIKAPFSAAVLRMLTPAASFSGGRGTAVTRVFSCRASGRQGNGEDMRRIGDVLQPLLSEIDEIGGYRSPHMTPVLWSEGLFRHFDNRRQLAAYAGLAPTPWQSGAVDREQGVSKAGNPRLRTTLIQLAWLWLRNQPQSALTIWFHERVRRNAGRLRKTTIVALARKLLVALWKYVTTGVVIEGATMKAA